VPTLANGTRSKKQSTKTRQELLAKRVGTYDKPRSAELLEISLLDSAYMRSGASDDLLTMLPNRYRVDVEKAGESRGAEFAAKRSKEAKPQTTPKTKSVT